MYTTVLQTVKAVQWQYMVAVSCVIAQTTNNAKKKKKIKWICYMEVLEKWTNLKQ